MASDLAKTVGAQIRVRRLAAGLRYQRELADKMDSPTISNQTVSDWERGVNKPSDENLRQLAEILGCEVADFYAPLEPQATPDPFAKNGRESDITIQLDRIEQALGELTADLAESVRLLRAEATASVAAVLRRIDDIDPPTAQSRRRPRQ